VQLKVLVFGPIATAAGGRTLQVVVAAPRELDAAEVMRLIAEAYPSLRPMLASSRLAINSKYALASDTVAPSDELALIGMVSGG